MMLHEFAMMLQCTQCNYMHACNWSDWHLTLTLTRVLMSWCVEVGQLSEVARKLPVILATSNLEMRLMIAH